MVGNAKQRVLSTLNKEIKDGLNYGLYQPPFQGRAGKFLDDCRQLKEYNLTGPVANLEVRRRECGNPRFTATVLWLGETTTLYNLSHLDHSHY